MKYLAVVWLKDYQRYKSDGSVTMLCNNLEELKSKLYPYIRNEKYRNRMYILKERMAFEDFVKNIEIYEVNKEIKIKEVTFKNKDIQETRTIEVVDNLIIEETWI